MPQRGRQGGQHHAGKQQELQRVGMQKGLLSSPAAALESTTKRIALLATKPSATSDEANEVLGLQELSHVLRVLTADITAASFSKFQRLLRELRAPAFGWQMHDANDRLVIFSERIESLRWLERQLAQDLKLKANQLAILHGQMTDTDQQELVERFGRLDDCHDWMLLECLEFGLEAVLRAVCLIGNDNDVVPLGQNREHVPVFAWDAHDGGFGVVLQGAFETPASLRSGQCIDDFDGACEQHRGPLIERPDEGSARAVGPSRRSGEMFGAKSTLRIRVAVVSHDRTDGTRDADSRLVGDQGCLAVDRSGRGHR